MLVIGLCYAELTAMLPVAGGEVAYAYMAFGTGKAFLVGWFLAFGYVAVSAFEAISVGRVLGYLLPGLDRWPLYSHRRRARLRLRPGCWRRLLTAAITWINYRGVQRAARAADLADRRLRRRRPDLRRRRPVARRPGGKSSPGSAAARGEQPSPASRPSSSRRRSGSSASTRSPRGPRRPRAGLAARAGRC